MTLKMNKADYDEHLVKAITNDQLQGVACEQSSADSADILTITADTDIIKALEGLKGAGEEDIADTLGAYGIEFATPDSLSRRALEAFTANLFQIVKTIGDIEAKAIYYGYDWHTKGGFSREATKKMNAMYEALRAFNAWND